MIILYGYPTPKNINKKKKGTEWAEAPLAVNPIDYSKPGILKVLDLS